MRALISTSLLLVACGTEQSDPDWVFTVKVSNQPEDCAEASGHVKDPTTNNEVSSSELCFCEDELSAGVQNSSCAEDITESKESFTYELYFDGDSVAIEIDGQPFASGTVLGCELAYSSPTWLQETANGDVQWSVTSHYVQADGAGVCQISGQYDFLGVEEYTVVESENEDYPKGRVVRKVISGYTKASGGE